VQAIEPIEVQRNRCNESRDLLRDLIRIHVEIDAPSRKVGTDEPDWVFRLRNVCLHAVAIAKCAVDVDGVHAMAAELRAAYEQMDVVWKCLPDEFRFDEDRLWWSTEAKGRLAEYTHPTPITLGLSFQAGGFADAEAPESYLQVAVWVGRLGCGYGLALAYLARVLGAEADVDSRLQAVMPSMR
jgi:hypothetical protein